MFDATSSNALAQLCRKAWRRKSLTSRLQYESRVNKAVKIWHPTSRSLTTMLNMTLEPRTFLRMKRVEKEIVINSQIFDSIRTDISRHLSPGCFCPGLPALRCRAQQWSEHLPNLAANYIKSESSCSFKDTGPSRQHGYQPSPWLFRTLKH